ncbi:MAG: ferrous iron transport protein A [Candidatus Marinimicrobia bacterium]|nr:ferrous iron transport protein A [Candidatus Neomarinimicrobiota bacterium]
MGRKLFGFGFGRRHNRKRRHRLDISGKELFLSDLQAGERVRVVAVGGSEHFRIRLMEMGILIGDIIEVSKYAPLQDPMEIIVKGYHLALRVSDSEKIIVEYLKD